MKSFSIIIPILNEKKNIQKLVNKIFFHLKKRKFEIIFVDDQSTDGTIHIISNLSKKYSKIKYFVRNNKEKDLSKSCILGFEKAKYNNIIVMDGDLQHDPKYIPLILKKFFSKNLDFIICARDFSNKNIQGLSTIRYFASKILIYLFIIFIGNKTLDPMSGYFLFKKKIYNENKKVLFKKGYKILSDLIYSPQKNFLTSDNFISFKNRGQGKSKMNLKVLLRIIEFVFFIILKKLVKI